MKQSVLPTKTIVADLLKRETTAFCQTQKLLCDSSFVSGTLNISRSLASQYLNELVKSGDCIKINTRPVYFLHRNTLENAFQIKLQEDSFDDVKELTQRAEKDLLEHKSFAAAIGHEASLSYCVAQCRSAVQYPPCGLPIVIWGEHGVGKSLFASLLYGYAREEKCIPAKAQLIHYYTDKNQENTKEDVKKIFGYTTQGMDGDKRHAGLLDTAAGGVLVIHDAEDLSVECCVKLVKYIKNDPVIKKEAGGYTKLVFLTCEDPAKVMDSTLLQQIPILCRLPSLEERPAEEKEDLAIYYLRREADRVGRNILISIQALNAVIHCRYESNVAEMIRCIKNGCANAFLQADPKPDVLRLLCYHLPEYVMAEVEPPDADAEGEALVDIASFQRVQNTDRILGYYNNVLQLFEQYMRHDRSPKDFLHECRESINLYYDYILFEKKYAASRVRVIEEKITGILEDVGDKYEVLIPANCSFVLARVAHKQTQAKSPLIGWETNHQKQVQELQEFLRQNYETESLLADRIAKRVRALLDMAIGGMNLVFLTLNIVLYNSDVMSNRSVGLILAHGFSTATAIADTANRLIGSCVFDAIDMPLDILPQQVTKTLRQYICKNSLNRDIILLVDMGSLEYIGDKLREISNINIGIINNVSTGLALHVGTMIRQGLSNETILQTACERNVCRYRFLPSSANKDVILFTNETGDSATARVVQLFRNSLPKNINIGFVTYDYGRLSKNLDDDEVFRQYNVLFVTGTRTLHLSKAPFVALENIIAFSDIERINRILSPYFSAEELTLFNESLLKNFTLENVMNHLTILNADKLLSYIEAALKQMENLLGRQFPNPSKVVLYIHISCLVESIVTKSQTENTAEQQPQDREMKAFVKLFNECFADLYKHYDVRIPLNEICYIKSYIT
ncbi:sigma 54-interacting transcriptional regulator [Caproiciproducens sp.]